MKCASCWSIDGHEADLLRQRMSELRRMLMSTLDQTGELPVIVFDGLRDRRHTMTDPVQAEQLIAEGHAAIHDREINRLRTVNARLRQLLREPLPDVDPFSTIRKA